MGWPVSAPCLWAEACSRGGRCELPERPSEGSRTSLLPHSTAASGTHKHGTCKGWLASQVNPQGTLGCNEDCGQQYRALRKGSCQLLGYFAWWTDAAGVNMQQ